MQRKKKKIVSMNIWFKSFLPLSSHSCSLICFSPSLPFSPDGLLRLAESGRHAKGRKSAFEMQLNIGSMSSLSNLQRGALYPLHPAGSLPTGGGQEMAPSYHEPIRVRSHKCSSVPHFPCCHWLPVPSYLHVLPSLNVNYKIHFNSEEC